MNEYIVKNGKELRIGYTTGSCAAAAATAAAAILLGREVSACKILLPSGEAASFQINNITKTPEQVSCSVTKDGGDDPDVTTGLEIFATVRKTKDKGIITVDGGEGVGRVTAKGLRCPVGEAAINPTPRKMITENVKKLCSEVNYGAGLDVIISVPGGAEIAKKTYNERLGIIGGISILGTTGIVEPMSEKALVDTIKVVTDRQKLIDSENVLISPGNYGKDFCRENLGLDIDRAVQISNFVGESLDYIKYKGFKRILFVGHTGKLIKIAAGVMNTHSYNADARMEIIGVHSAMAGADAKTVNAIMKCISTDEAFDLISDKSYYDEVKRSILEKVMYHLRYRLKDMCEIEVIMFTSNRRHIIKSEGAEEMLTHFMEVKN